MGKVTYANTADRADQLELRAVHGVRLVTADEEGLGVNALPTGVYGYTYSPGLPNAPLFAERRFHSYETHKLAGDVLVIGYADVETAAQVASALDSVSIRVRPEAVSESDVIVRIPYSRIRQHRQYAAPNQDGFNVTLVPAPGPVSTGRRSSLTHSDQDPA
jgi:hypothetical protein